MATGKKVRYLQTLRGDALRTAQIIFANRGTLADAQAATGFGASAGGGTYQVKKGDSFFSIADDVYKDQRFFEQLALANGGFRNTLKEGQIIKLPTLNVSKSPTVSYDAVALAINKDASLGHDVGKAATDLFAQINANPRLPDQNKANLLGFLEGIEGFSLPDSLGGTIATGLPTAGAETRTIGKAVDPSAGNLAGFPDPEPIAAPFGGPGGVQAAPGAPRPGSVPNVLAKAISSAAGRSRIGSPGFSPSTRNLAGSPISLAPTSIASPNAQTEGYSDAYLNSAGFLGKKVFGQPSASTGLTPSGDAPAPRPLSGEGDAEEAKELLDIWKNSVGLDPNDKTGAYPLVRDDDGEPVLDENEQVVFSDPVPLGFIAEFFGLPLEINDFSDADMKKILDWALDFKMDFDINTLMFTQAPSSASDSTSPTPSLGLPEADPDYRLRLYRDPDVYFPSWYRPNLQYRQPRSGSRTNSGTGREYGQVGVALFDHRVGFG